MEQYDRFRIYKAIDSEHGPDYHRNVALDGYTFTYGDSFIHFAYTTKQGKTFAIISYLYATSREALIELLSYSSQAWTGMCVRGIIYLEHKKKANYSKLLKHLGFNVSSNRVTDWKYPWTSTNGYEESDCIQAISM